MERMEATYFDQAVKNGSLVVSSCEYDLVPAELGFMFNSRQWVLPAVPNRVEAYVSLESDNRVVGNFGTYESAILGIANAGKLNYVARLCNVCLEYGVGHKFQCHKSGLNLAFLYLSEVAPCDKFENSSSDKTLGYHDHTKNRGLKGFKAAVSFVVGIIQKGLEKGCRGIGSLGTSRNVHAITDGLKDKSTCEKRVIDPQGQFLQR
ncbi:hypothetical protein OROMI_003935 [Orobanche minor]